MIVEGGWHWMAKTAGGVLNLVPFCSWGNDELKASEKKKVH
jgi:hypothetical protein